MIKTSTFLFFLIFLSSRIFAQELKKEEFLGSLKVLNCSILPEFEKELDTDARLKMEEMRKAFVGAIFYFGIDNSFDLSVAPNAPSFMKEFEISGDAKWKIDNGKRILIGTKADGYTIMGINIKYKQGKKYLILEESPFILEVIKQ